MIYVLLDLRFLQFVFGKVNEQTIDIHDMYS